MVAISKGAMPQTPSQPTDEENVDIDLQSAELHSWFDELLRDNDKGTNANGSRKPWMTWSIPGHSSWHDAGPKEERLVRINGKFAPYAQNDYVKSPPNMSDWVKTTIVQYTEDSDWHVASYRQPVQSRVDYDEADGEIEVMLVILSPPRMYLYWKDDKPTNVAFKAVDLDVLEYEELLAHQAENP